MTRGRWTALVAVVVRAASGAPAVTTLANGPPRLVTAHRSTTPDAAASSVVAVATRTAARPATTSVT